LDKILYAVDKTDMPVCIIMTVFLSPML
jgi:hypothetical protein